NSIWFYYDGHRLSELRSTSGHIVQFVYRSERISKLRALYRDSSQTLSSYEYDSDGQLAAVFDTAGIASSYECAAGLITRITNRLGGSHLFEYDRQGRCTRTWQEPSGAFRSVQYDDPGRRALVMDSMGQRTLFRFNEQNLLKETVRFDGSVIRRFYAGSNEAIASEGDPEPENQYVFDEHGNILQEIEPDGAKWEWSYDSRNRITRENSPDGAAQNFEFDDSNHIVRHQDGRGGLTSLE